MLGPEPDAAGLHALIVATMLAGMSEVSAVIGPILPIV